MGDKKIHFSLKMVLTLFAFFNLTTCFAIQAAIVDDPGLQQSLKMLWANSDADRLQGRDHLLRMGAVAKAPLVTLLRDLIDDQRPRFPIGKEEEGKAAVDKYVRSIQTSHGKSEDDDASQKIDELAINHRLMSDVIYLLGELKAAEAVPSLIEIMKGTLLRSSGRNEFGSISPEMKALIRIGGGAVPQLIKEMESGDANLVKIKEFNWGYSLRVEYEESPSPSFKNDDDGQRYKRVYHAQESLKEMLETKIALVLGEIGDQRALSILKKKLKLARSNTLTSSLKTAILRIEHPGQVPREPFRM